LTVGVGAAFSDGFTCTLVGGGVPVLAGAGTATFAGSDGAGAFADDTGSGGPAGAPFVGGGVGPGGVGFASSLTGGLLGPAGAGAASFVGGAGTGAFAGGAGTAGRGLGGGGGGGAKNSSCATYPPPIRMTPIPAMMKIRRIPPLLPLGSSSGAVTSAPSSSVLRLRKLNLAMSPPSLLSGGYLRDARIGCQ
jgi:hypothetical protein